MVRAIRARSMGSLNAWKRRIKTPRKQCGKRRTPEPRAPSLGREGTSVTVGEGTRVMVRPGNYPLNIEGMKIEYSLTLHIEHAERLEEAQ